MKFEDFLWPGIIIFFVASFIVPIIRKFIREYSERVGPVGDIVQ